MKWIFILLLNAPAFAQQNFVNANVQTHSAATGLAKVFEPLVNGQAAPAWIAYSVSTVDGVHICCSTYTNRNVPTILQQRPCMLEGSNQSMDFDVGADREGSSESVLVLYRVEEKKIARIRTFSGDCILDTGGLPVHWLADVRAPESIKLLETFVPNADDAFRETRKKSEGAVSAIALHRDPEADRMLERFTDPKGPEYVRRNASFWLGNTRGEKGYQVLRKVLRDDPSEKVREQAVFALSLSKAPEAVSAITAAIDSDPDLKVRKKAVFALSQLPKGQGIPKLIELARKHRDPEVRKEAMFWLGHSKDDRAMAFFEDVLLGRRN